MGASHSLGGPPLGLLSDPPVNSGSLDQEVVEGHAKIPPKSPPLRPKKNPRKIPGTGPFQQGRPVGASQSQGGPPLGLLSSPPVNSGSLDQEVIEGRAKIRPINQDPAELAVAAAGGDPR